MVKLYLYNYKEVQNGRLKEHLRGNKKTQK